jgi:hypothetical protein
MYHSLQNRSLEIKNAPVTESSSQVLKKYCDLYVLMCSELYSSSKRTQLFNMFTNNSQCMLSESRGTTRYLTTRIYGCDLLVSPTYFVCTRSGEGRRGAMADDIVKEKDLIHNQDHIYPWHLTGIRSSEGEARDDKMRTEADADVKNGRAEC